MEMSSLFLCACEGGAGVRGRCWVGWERQEHRPEPWKERSGRRSDTEGTGPGWVGEQEVARWPSCSKSERGPQGGDSWGSGLCPPYCRPGWPPGTLTFLRRL